MDKYLLEEQEGERVFLAPQMCSVQAAQSQALLRTLILGFHQDCH